MTVLLIKGGKSKSEAVLTYQQRHFDYSTNPFLDHGWMPTSRLHQGIKNKKLKQV